MASKAGHSREICYNTGLLPVVSQFGLKSDFCKTQQNQVEAELNLILHFSSGTSHPPAVQKPGFKLFIISAHSVALRLFMPLSLYFGLFCNFGKIVTKITKSIAFTV